METATVRVWSGVQEALQITAHERNLDASALASMLLMGALFQADDVPEKAKTLLAEDFFAALGEAMTNKKSELAQWAMSMMKGKKPG